MTADAFFKEFQRIIYTQPKLETHVLYSQNCRNSDHVFDSKNLEYCFDTSASSDSMYLFDCHLVTESMDCDYTVEAGASYECMDVLRCHNCSYVNKADDVQDSMYSYDLSNCHDVFGCVNLKNKSYCIFNRQLTKDEYFEKVKKYQALPPEKVLEMLEELKLKYPITQAAAERNVNSPFGNNVYNCKNCYMCFDAGRCEDCGYLYDSFDSKFCYDTTYMAQNAEMSYQIVGSTHMFNCNYVINSENCQDSSYLFNCKGVKNSLGCVGLQYKEFCILNRQFSKEEYENLSKQILQELNSKNLEWGTLAV